MVDFPVKLKWTTLRFWCMGLFFGIIVQVGYASEADSLSNFRVGINLGSFNHSDYPDHDSQIVRVTAESLLNRYVSTKISYSSVTYENTTSGDELSWSSPDDFTCYTMGVQYRDIDFFFTPVFELSLMVRDTRNRKQGILLGFGVELRTIPNVFIEARYSRITYGLNPVEGSVIKTLSGIQVGLNYQISTKW